MFQASSTTCGTHGAKKNVRLPLLTQIVRGSTFGQSIATTMTNSAQMVQ